MSGGRFEEEKKRRGVAFYVRGVEWSEENNDFPVHLENALVCGDSEEELKKLPDNCVDIIVTSPPYNFAIDYDATDDSIVWEVYFEKLRAIFKECSRILKYGGRIVINVQPGFSDAVPTHHILSSYMMELGLLWKGEIIWDKNNYNCAYTAWGSFQSPSNPYLKCTHEFVEVYCKGSFKKEGDRDKIDILKEEFIEWVTAKWDIAPAHEMKLYGHDAMFPQELVRRILKLFSYQGDVVLDPFSGAGTTCVVAKTLNRRYFGVDISEKYTKTARKRVNEAYYQVPLFHPKEQENE